MRLEIRNLEKRTKLPESKLTYFIMLCSSHGFSKMKKRGCVSSSRDMDRLNKAFQATKYVQNSGM
jgi:hypothetical protein